MLFGLRNVAQTFEHFMDKVLWSQYFCYDYITDQLNARPNPEENKQHLQLVFETLQDHGVIINPAKCELGVT